MDMLDFYLKELGFDDEEMEAIWGYFTCRLDQEDWESISFVDEVDDDEVEESENYYKLPTGRIVYFPDELIHKDKLAQID